LSWYQKSCKQNHFIQNKIWMNSNFLLS
jgi:hypothetical protein